MKKTFLLCILFALCCGSAMRVLAAFNPGERFLDAFFLIQDGDAAQAKSNWQTAADKYAAALKILQEIQAQAPDWNTRLLEYRTHYCTDHLAEITPKLPPPAPPAQEVAPAVTAPEAAAPPPAVAPATTAPVAAAPVVAAPASAENGQIQQLTDELRQSQEKFRQMEQDRDALKAKLDEELNKPAPTDRAGAQKALEQLHALETVRDALNAKLQAAEAKAVQVETLQAELQKSQEKVRQLEASQAELTAQAAKSQQEIQRLEATEASQAEQAAKSQERIHQLEASQADLKAKLKDALSKAPSAQPAGQTGDWQKKNAELAAKLTETERQLRAAKSSNEKNSDIIVALRKENEQLHQALNRTPASTIAEPEETETSSGLNTELRGWHPRHPSPANEQASSRPATTTPKQAPASAATAGPANNKKLVATINAPRPAPPTAKTNVVVQAVSAPVKTNTVQAAAAPTAPAPVAKTVAVPAPAAPVAPTPVNTNAVPAAAAPAETNAAQATPAPMEVTPARITKVNNTYRFVVIDFASHPMPALGTRLAVYRDGKPVGQVQLTEPVRDRFATADILQGELHVGDEPH